MKYADSQVPIATSQIVARWTRLDRRSQPKIQSPRKVDSRKNAASPSIASGAPKTFPTYFAYTAQFMPNWNSCTRPVATPIAKLISSSVPKNFVRRSHASSPLRYHSVCMTATRGASPSVSGTNRKWYSVVVANWIRARSTVVDASDVIGAWLPATRSRPCRPWMEGRRTRPPPRDYERSAAQRKCDQGGERVDGGEADAVVQQRADPEGGDSVADLVEGDHAACDRGGDRRQLLLAEADREREQSRAAEAGEPEGQDAERRRILGQRCHEQEGGCQHEGQHVIGNA